MEILFHAKRLVKEEGKFDSHKLITVKAKGFLKYPFIHLCYLVGLLERKCVGVTQKQGVHNELLLNITNEIENLYPLPKVGLRTMRYNSQEVLLDSF